MLLVPVAHSLPHQPPQGMVAAVILPAQHMFLALNNVLCSSHHDGPDIRISLPSWAAFLTDFCFMDFSKPLWGTGRTSDRAIPTWWVIFLTSQTLQGKILLTVSWISPLTLSPELFSQRIPIPHWILHILAHGLLCWGTNPPVKNHLPQPALQVWQAPKSQNHNLGAFWSHNSTLCSFNGIFGVKMLVKLGEFHRS